LATLQLKGKIFSGKGEGTKYMQLQWAKTQITRKLGFIPYNGTLNIKLTEESIKTKKQLESANATEITPQNGFCRAICFPALLNENVKCALLIPEIADYPEDVAEIIASTNLRKQLHLKDGDQIQVTVFL